MLEEQRLLEEQRILQEQRALQEQRIREEQRVLEEQKFLEEQNMKRVFLVAEPTNQQDEVIYQAYYYDGKQPKPVLVQNQQDQTVPLIFSRRSIATAFNTDGRYDVALQRTLQSGIDERNALLQRYGINQ